MGNGCNGLIVALFCDDFDTDSLPEKLYLDDDSVSEGSLESSIKTRDIQTRDTSLPSLISPKKYEDYEASEVTCQTTFKSFGTEYTDDNKQGRNDNSVALVSCGKKRKERLSKLKILVKGINDAVSENRCPCKGTLTRIFDTVDHDETEYHDDEVDSGLAVALCHLLDLVLKKNDQKHLDKKLQLICTSLELIHRCCNIQCEESFENIGNELVDLLIRVIDVCLSISHEQRETSGTTTGKAIRIFGYFAAVKNAHTHMLENTKILDGIVKIILFSRESDSRVDAVWTVSNLAFTNAGRDAILAHPDLLKALFNFKGKKHQFRTEVAAVLLNLTVSSSNQESLIDCRPFLPTLVRLMSTGSDEARSRAAGAFRNLSTNNFLIPKLTSFADGIIIDTLINGISSHMDDRKTCCRATATLKNFVRETNAEAMANHTGLLAIFTAIITESNNPEAATSASVALKKITWEINHPSKSHQTMLNFLKMTNNMIDEDGYNLLLSELFLIQASKEENQIVLANRPGVFESMASLTFSNNVQTRSNGVKILRLLVKKEENHNRLVQNKAFILAANNIIRRKGAENQESQAQLLEVLSILSTRKENKELLANNKMLLEAMSNYVMSDQKYREHAFLS
eukprot:CAMPEP_0194276532 /NCGR_PEP_ID=MMETSP0169-20130528/9104_1 /TAXON_ID=218684 /ORGANISM="Corethron pennatum, Strain L29A3" /LENGTH=626 /DNA_ID=CAMNT_0039020275 /DNA_START=154 /DNA_END=2034 /DNA_ORIENTATION=+